MNTDPRRPVQNKTAQKPAAKAPQKAAVKAPQKAAPAVHRKRR